MNYISYRTDKDILYIQLSGRIDASNATDVEAEINAARQEHQSFYTVLDADELEYISSAGLRIILRLRKSEPKLAIINASSEVYSVFEMTGFTDMITIEKTFPRLSIEGCEFIAKGANGAVYRYDDETIVKQYFNRDALAEIKQERENARKAFVLGVNTAIPYGIVRIGEGYGSVTELLDATSISKLIKANPEDLSTAVAYFVDTMKSIHSIEVEEGEFPDYKKVSVDWAVFLKDYLSQEQGDKLVRLFNELPESRNLIHGDYHTNNVLVQNGEPLIIDLDTLASGCPILELGSMYNAFVGFGDVDKKIVESFIGFDYETSKRFWRLSLARYINSDDEAVIDDVEKKAKLVGYTRLLRRCIRRGYNEVFIDYYKERLVELLEETDTLIY